MHPMSDPVLIGRAAQVVVAALTARFLPLFKTERAALGRFLWPTLRNWNGFEVGALRATDAVAGRLNRTVRPEGPTTVSSNSQR